jgi:hypothetical protein
MGTLHLSEMQAFVGSPRGWARGVDEGGFKTPDKLFDPFLLNRV